MLKKAYILHGCCDKEEYFSNQHPSPSNFHWLPWLQKQLLINGFDCQTPEMPAPYKPDYQKWAKIFNTYPINENTTLIAHSCGCGFLLRWLSENNHKIAKLIMVAPWIDPYQSHGDFLKFEPDTKLSEHIDEIHILYSSDEPVKGVKETVNKIIQIYPKATLHQFETMGHFCLEEMGTDKFPELLEIIL